MTLKNQKLISSFLIMAIIVPSFFAIFTVKRAEAQIPTTDVVNAALTGTQVGLDTVGKATGLAQLGLKIKETIKAILAEALKIIARRALAEMTKSTVNWINTGFHGAPLFLEHPKSFFNDVGKSEIKNLVNMIGYDSQRYPFAKSYLLNVIGNYRNTLRNNAQYSLSKATSDPALLRNYRYSFGVGGWEGFMLNTQYPQNNAFGAQFLMGNDLVQNIQEESASLQKLLQQGQGFLSPQVCLTNPNYDNDANPYNLPSFDVSTVPYDGSYQAAYDLALQNSDPNVDQLGLALQNYNFSYEQQVKAAKGTWDADHTCPGVGLTNTTPGAVVASRIMDALGTTQKQGELSAALGNSLSAVFDALLYKLVGDGLTALSTHINPQQTDRFSYYGATFSGTNDPGWTAAPDQEVILDDFKKLVSGKTVITDPATGAIIQENVGDTSGTTGGTYVPGAIANTALELQLIYNSTPNNQNPGLIQVLDSTWPVAKNLDMCIPGPNKNWEKKLDDERDRMISGKLMAETANDDPLKVRASKDAVRELKFAINTFKDWITTKMIGAMPSAILFMDAVKEMDTNNQQYKELNDKLRDKRTALARLNAIEAALAPLTTQPPIGSAQEKNLISIKKQYDAVEASIANPASIDGLQSQLDLAKERKQNLLLLENQCKQERAASGWGTPGLGDGGSLSISSLPSNKGMPYFTVDRAGIANTFVAIGTEKEVFCDVPIVSGYSHGEVIRNDESARNNNCPFSSPSFCNSVTYDTTGWFTFRSWWPSRHGSTPPQPVPAPLDAGQPGYQDLPLVNAIWYYGDKANGFPVSGDVDCKLLFKVKDIDYKYAGEEAF